MGEEESIPILEGVILQVLSEERGAPIPDSQQVPPNFAFEDQPVSFKLKVFKRTLEEIIRKLEEHDDYQTFPEESLLAVKRGLIDTNKKFYTQLESKPRPTDITAKIKEVHPLLREALACIYVATTELEDKGKSHGYYRALLDSRDQLSEIKLMLKAWDIKKGNP